jgi:alpha-amylase/alpha-mannosidase (GH57 family)
MERYICIHGHFYQPPRENPWLEAVELQDSASPYHDWNEKITAECYAPNASSRIMDERGRILEIVNNYATISFDFGPTLLAWLDQNAPDIYSLVLQADRQSQPHFSGHGSALAQAYNHVILPLANHRDKVTQVRWGIRDFQNRFGRKPEGLWLPETAVDLDSLDILAEEGISFTILAPHQARRIRRVGEAHWQDVSGGRVDPTRAYAIQLPSGRAITLFFYDGPISRAIAFEGLLNRGESFAERLLSGFSEERSWPQLMHVATDGESYGHHHRYGDMALASALNHIESEGLAKLTNYGEFLEKHPTTHEVEIYENTSWSCCHGVERWRRGCGCNLGGHPEWHQDWRGPLREALDWLRDSLAQPFEDKAGTLLKDAWEARNDYVQVILDRSQENVDGFMARHTLRALTPPERETALKLLEIQRHAMLMYTSCGWFFDDLSGIETVQIIQYAGRVLQLARETLGVDLEPRFLETLEEAKSNIPEQGDGRQIYEKWVKPAVVDLETVGAHYAMSSIFEDYGDRTSIYCFNVDREDYQSFDAGRAKLVTGRAKVISGITQKSAGLSFGVLYFGDHTLNCGVGEDQVQDSYQSFVDEVSDFFARGDFPETIRTLDRYFGHSPYSLKSLFRDEQRKILYLMLENTLKEAEAAYRQLYEYHAPMMHYLKDLGVPAPKALSAAAELALNIALRRAFENEEMDPELIQSYLNETKEDSEHLLHHAPVKLPGIQGEIRTGRSRQPGMGCALPPPGRQALGTHLDHLTRTTHISCHFGSLE